MSSRAGIPDPVAALFPGADESEQLDAWLTHHIAAALERVRRGSVMPDLDMADFVQQLVAIDFGNPRPAREILTWAIEQLEHGTVHMTHPRYFGLFNPAPSAPAQWADRIVGAFNPQLASSGSSPAPVEIETHVVRALGRRAGFREEVAGHFTPSGSDANLTSLVCALTRAHPRFAEAGVRAFPGEVALYTSRECHPAWTKIAHQTGIGRTAVRLVATDGTGRMDLHALATAIGDDLHNGTKPVLVVATAGTTGGGMIDPIPGCAAIAREHGAWYHIDAAWGGAALCSDRLRELLAGIELADSVTIDAHKWFATTMGCGMFITPHSRILGEAYHVGAEFMPSQSASKDPYLNSMHWSRRFLGLRLFLTLAVAGWQGIACHVERAVAVIQEVRAQLLDLGWTVLNDSSLAVLCVIPPADGPDIRTIVSRTLRSGRAWVARSLFEGREVIRICATHGETSQRDVEELVRVLSGD